MESLGAFPDGEWDSISRLLFAEDSFQNNDNGGLNSEVNPLSFWFSEEADKNKMEIDESLFFSSDNPNSNLGNFCQESSACGYSSSIFLPTQSQDNYYLSDYNHIPYINNSSGTFDLSMLAQKNICSDLSVCPDVLTRDVKLDGCHSEAVIVPETESHLKRKSDILEHEARPDNKSNESPKKRSRVSRERVNKNAHSKKSQKLTPILDDEEEDNARQNGQTTSCDSSDDDSNASLELSGGPNSDSKVADTVNLKAKKTKASKVSATDSQSIYARKRREKINERLKILQNLVPNGTKVDISTMLEEAVHYVKFLQVQIKLLSSDDHWMYAPLAYNGMDIGFLRTISPTL